MGRIASGGALCLSEEATRMNARRCLKIAARIGTLLEQEIGTGVDAGRMLTDRLYMRDVLLVCEAHRGHELAELATWFRRSAAERSADSLVTSGFGADSLFPNSMLGAGADSQRDSSGPVPLPTPAELVRQQLDQQRAAARRGGQLLAMRTGAR